MYKFFRNASIIGTIFVTGLLFAQVVNVIKVGRNHSIDWQAPTTNEDGSVLTDLAGYKVGIFDSTVVPGDGTAPIYLQDIQDPALTESALLSLATDAALGQGTYVFAVLAYDLHENESEWSDYLVLDVKVTRPNKLIITIKKGNK
ncbi:MAG: hypothetical protein ACXADW_02955 [Candidatus Hodarchaeales archaeon]|jgi:hypothetical protein